MEKKEGAERWNRRAGTRTNTSGCSVAAVAVLQCEREKRNGEAGGSLHRDSNDLRSDRQSSCELRKGDSESGTAMAESRDPNSSGAFRE